MKVCMGHKASNGWRPCMTKLKGCMQGPPTKSRASATLLLHVLLAGPFASLLRLCFSGTLHNVHFG